jgi:hypothetical protein
MKPIFTLDNMIRANAEFWAKATARFKARVNERPGDVRRALDATAKQFEWDRAVSGTEIDAVRKQRSLEAKIFELEEIEAGQTSERNSSYAKRERKARINPIHLVIIGRMKRNRDSSDSEILSALLNEVENGSIELSPDKKSFVATDEDGKRFRLSVTSLSPIISRLRRKIV